MARSTHRAQSDTVANDRIASVPDRKYLDTYINRTIDGQRDFDVYDFALDNKMNILIEGDTGTGKTSSVVAYAAYKNLPFYSISSSRASDPSQLFGKYIIDEVTGKFVWQDGPVTDIVRHGGALLINEITFLPDGIASSLFGLFDKRRKIDLVDHKGEVIYAPDDFIVFADYNLGDAYHGTRPLNAALENRFALRLCFDYDTDIEAKLVKSPALLKVAKQFRAQVAKGEFDTPISTNMLVEFEQVAFALGVPFACANFANKFHSRVRPAIKQVFETHKSNIESDFAEMKAVGGNTEKPKSDWGSESFGNDWQYADSDFTYTRSI